MKILIVTLILILILLSAGFAWLSIGSWGAFNGLSSPDSLVSEWVSNSRSLNDSGRKLQIQTRAPLVMWSVIEGDYIPEIRGYQGNVEGAIPLALKIKWSWEITVGENITIFIPQIDSHFTVTVTQVKSQLRGIKVITATSVDDAVELLLTLGQNSTFANLGTPQGSYELVGTASYGWLVPSKHMDQHIDYVKSDYVLEKIREPSFKKQDIRGEAND